MSEEQVGLGIGEPGQLTEMRVPLELAAFAFTQRDGSGRLPIIVIPQRISRINNELLLAALALLVAGIVGESLLNLGWLLPVAGLLALLAAVAAVFRAFIVQIPEGISGLLAQGGRYTRTLGSGLHYILPYVAVSHLVTRREIPYDAPPVEALSSDNVRATVDTLLTFSIAEPHKFVYTISADDFDRVLQAACQEALRRLVRQKTIEEVVSLQRDGVASLREVISQDLAPYGLTLHKFIVTAVLPPEEFVRSQEARQLAIVQLAEQRERQSLALQRQADEAELARRQIAAEAENEALRLTQLEDRLARFPGAASYDLQRARLAVGRAVAANSRALIRLDTLDELGVGLPPHAPLQDRSQPGQQNGGQQQDSHSHP